MRLKKIGFFDYIYFLLRCLVLKSGLPINKIFLISMSKDFKFTCVFDS